MSSSQKSSKETLPAKQTTSEISQQGSSRELPIEADTSAESLLDQFHSKTIRKVETPDQALAIPGATLRQIKDHRSEDFMLAFLEALILQTQDFLGSAKPMNETQVKITAQMMLDDYPHFKIPDLRGIFNRIMKGKITIYGSMTGTTIMTACEQWHNDRCDIAAINSQNNRESHDGNRTGETSLRERFHEIDTKKFKTDHTK